MFLKIVWWCKVSKHTTNCLIFCLLCRQWKSASKKKITLKYSLSSTWTFELYVKVKAQIFLKLQWSQRLQRHLWCFIFQEEVNSVLWLPSKACPKRGVGMHSLEQKPYAHTGKYRITFTGITLPPASWFPLDLSQVTNVGGDIQLILKISSTCKLQMPKSADIYRLWSHLWINFTESSVSVGKVL